MWRSLQNLLVLLWDAVPVELKWSCSPCASSEPLRSSSPSISVRAPLASLNTHRASTHAPTIHQTAFCLFSELRKTYLTASRLHQCVCVCVWFTCQNVPSGDFCSRLTWTERHIDGAADRNNCWCHVLWDGETVRVRNIRTLFKPWQHEHCSDIGLIPALVSWLSV